jgi:hypothetical protein
MLYLLVSCFVIAIFLWLFSIRPYCRRNGKGFTVGATAGITFWVDWQVAGELAKKKGDSGMIFVCRVFGILHVAGLLTLLSMMW